MIKLDFVPLCCEWIYSPGDAIAAVAISDQESNKIFVYDGQGTGTPLHVFEKLHTKPVVSMKVRASAISTAFHAFCVTIFIQTLIVCSTILYMRHVSLWTKQVFWNIGPVLKRSTGFPNVLRSIRNWTQICLNSRKIRRIHAA